MARLITRAGPVPPPSPITDLQATSAPTGGYSTRGVGTLTFSCDPVADIHDGVTAASGVASYVANIAGVDQTPIAAPSPNIIAAPTFYNIGGISPTPTGVQAGRQFTIVAAGTGADGTSDQLGFFGWEVTGEFDLYGKLASFTGPGFAYAIASLMAREATAATVVATPGARYISIGQWLSANSQGVQAKSRTTASAPANVDLDHADGDNTGKMLHLRKRRSGTTDTWTLEWGAGSNWTPLASQVFTGWSNTLVIGAPCADLQASPATLTAVWSSLYYTAGAQAAIAAPAYTTSGATTCKWKTVDVNGNVSAYSPQISDNPNTSSVRQFHPGLYFEDSANIRGFGGSYTPVQDLAWMLTANAVWLGLCIETNWGVFEQTKGVYDFTCIHNTYASLAAAGKRLVIYQRYEAVPFVSAATAYSQQYMPAYLNDRSGANVYGGLLDINFGSTFGGVVTCFNRPAVRAAFVDMITALLNDVVPYSGLALKDSPMFEGIIFVETSYNLASPTSEAANQGAWDDAYITQYNLMCTAIRAVAPNILIGRRANWGTNANMISVAQNSLTNAAALGNTDGPTNYCNIDDVLRGNVGGVDYRNSAAGNRIPLFCFSESVGFENGGFNITASELVRLAKSPTDWCANYFFPQRYPGHPWVNSSTAQIEAAYIAQGSAMQAVKPQSYP